MKNLAHIPLAIGNEPLQTILLCPACHNEIGIQELIERKGYIGCLNCIK